VKAANAASRFLLLAAVALAAASCGMATHLAYNNIATMYSNAAPMLAWMVDDYVDMSGSQKDWVKERFERTLAWHRTTELPEYRRLLETVAEKAEEPFRAEDVQQVYRELRAYYNRTAEHLLPHVADFLLQLDAEQVAQLEKKMADDNRRMARESGRGTPEERLRRRTERLFVHLEEFTGRLEPSQRALVAEHLRQNVDLTPERMADRRARQAELMALVRARPERERMIAGLRRLIIDTDSWRSAAYREKLRERERQTIGMLVALSQTLSRDQREHLQRRLRGYARDFRTLSAAT